MAVLIAIGIGAVVVAVYVAYAADYINRGVPVLPAESQSREVESVAG